MSEATIKPQKGSMFKYVQRKSQISKNENARDGDNDDDVNLNFEVVNLNFEGVDDTNVDDVVVSDVALDDDHSNEDRLSSDMIKVLVAEGPKRDKSIEKGLKDRFSRRFSSALYTRILPNNEKHDKEWLVYSKETDKVVCFCCKIYRKGVLKSQLADEVLFDWQHLSTRLKEHEVGLVHLTNMTSWYDKRRRVQKNETIDKVAVELFEKEIDHRKKVLLRIIGMVKFLAKHNLAFCGSNERLYQNSNGNFLGLIEMLAEFDQIIKEHVRRITSDEIHYHYLGHTIQDEVILLLAHEINSEIIKKVKQAKYFFIILDCTPVISHQEQMYLILRYVNVTSRCISAKHNLAFCVSNERLYQNSNGNFLGLIEMLAEFDQIIKEHVRRITSDEIHYHYLGHTIQDEVILLLAHEINSEIIKKVKQAKCVSVEEAFLGFLNVDDTTGQRLFDVTHDALMSLGLDIDDIRVAKDDTDTLIQSGANSLAENVLGNFKFIVAKVIWFDILYTVNLVSKRIQSKDILIDVAIKEVKCLFLFKDYRETGYSKTIEEAKQIAIEMDIDPVFTQKRVIHRKKHFDENSDSQDVLLSADESFKVNYFLYIVDQAITSLTTRFEQYQEYENLFGFLFTSDNLKSYDDNGLMACCSLLEVALKMNYKSDVDAIELCVELWLLKNFFPNESLGPTKVLRHLKETDCFLMQ
ncbi:zinc finger MYM-type protein 1-like protein [Tanacetum coccineum]